MLNANNRYDITTYQYNYLNKQTQKVEPYKNNQSFKTTDYTYDKVGNLLSETTSIQGVSTTTSYVYDGLNEILKKVDPLGQTTRWIYDAIGNMVKKVDPRYLNMDVNKAPGFEYAYDALNRKVKTIAFDGTNQIVIGYQEYDGRGNVTKVVDAKGYNAANPEQSIGKEYQFDVYDNVTTYVSAQTAENNKMNGTSLFTDVYSYDALGHMLTKTDGLNHLTQYSYNLIGLLNQKIYPDGSKVSYNYDLTGKAMMSTTDQSGNVTKKYFNVFDQPYLIEYPDGTTKQFTYSPKGNLVQSVDQAGYVNYFSYDPSGNLLQKREYINQDNQYAYYRLLQNSYDEANRLLSKETFLQKNH